MLPFLVLSIILLMLIALYKEWVSASLVFLLAVVALILIGAIDATDFLAGFSNQQIITVILLVVITDEIRRAFPIERFFDWVFKKAKTGKGFLLRMMGFTATVSAIMNNTPLVAIMIPYVHNWSKKHGVYPSKLMLPLSYSTILGGMITVVGTSTNMVLNGLLEQNKQTLLGFKDFFFLGVLVTVVGGAYLYFFGYKLLPNSKDSFDDAKAIAPEYIVEAEVQPHSKLIGTKIKNTGFESLQGAYLIELHRGGEVISPTDSEDVLQAGDRLLFMGKPETIMEIMRANIGIAIPEKKQGGDIVEAVIPFGSSLADWTAAQIDFHENYDAELIAVHRNGQKMKGKVHEIKLQVGDFLLLSAGSHFKKTIPFLNELYVTSNYEQSLRSGSWHRRAAAVGLVLIVAAYAFQLTSLFLASFFILSFLLAARVTNIRNIAKSLDLDLPIMLVCALAIGVALVKSGAADLIANGFIDLFRPLGNRGIFAALFIATTVLTAFVTNVAAVSIAFPIALSVAIGLGVSPTPFFVGIAFAASGEFMTPMGYQTNLMVYGPGGYRFKDYLRVGTPLNIIYAITCIVFIISYYGI